MAENRQVLYQGLFVMKTAALVASLVSLIICPTPYSLLKGDINTGGRSSGLETNVSKVAYCILEY